MRILCIGTQWRGGDDGALFRAFARLGHLIDIVDEGIYFPMFQASAAARLASRVIRAALVAAFNEHVIRSSNAFQPDLVVVFKGRWVTPASLRQIKKSAPVILVYPDVSMTAHGRFIPECIPLYTRIFTTKSFGKTDLARFGYSRVTFVPPSFDPDVHRRFPEAAVARSPFCCDVSFIGTFSPQKYRLLLSLHQALPAIRLRIFGSQWPARHGDPLLPCIEGFPITGDLYSLAIQSAKINLGLLSEQVTGASSGDNITARTFQIPGAGGFLLHRRTAELAEYFIEDQEVACFETSAEVIESVVSFLGDPVRRESICEMGHLRAWREYKIDARAVFILSRIEADSRGDERL